MKKLSILTTPAIALGVGVLCAPQALAASYTLSQTNINAAAGAAGTNTNGIFCDDVQKDFCTLDAGDWTQEGDIDLTTVEIDAGIPINGLVLQNNVNISNPDNRSIKGNINVSDADVNLTNLNITGNVGVDGATKTTLTDLTINGNLQVSNANAEVTITGGTYTGEGWGSPLDIGNAKSVTIDNATFAAGGASAAYINGGDITINSGSFTSTGDNGIELFGANSLKISGGTFTGAAAGIAFGYSPAAGTVSLTGGTFTGTGTNGKAIYNYTNSDSTLISGLVTNGYHFTNSTVTSESGMGGGAYIAGTTKVLADGQSESEESTTQPTDPTSTSTTTKKSGIGAPDTGAFTAEEGSATSSSSILTVMATVLVALTGAILVKKHSKRA
ncbi:hypothetical protein J6S55_02790 [Candidatus Saccharibacteria bacterium]|nr:hypothetical protein [Candidatus Saccharibacteria bacterium]